jgi:mono/diheme cytochrome c family protein
MVLFFLCFTLASLFGFRQLGIIQCSFINPCTLAILCVVLCGRPCVAQAKEDPRPALNKAKGLYQQLCQRCHAANGKGDSGTKGVPDFTRSAWHERKSDAQLIVRILDGEGTAMPAFRGRLDQAKAGQLVAYIRTFAAVPAEQSLSPASSEDFDGQMRKLQKEYDELQKQLRELAAEQHPEPVPQKSSEKRNSGQGTKQSLRSTRVLFHRHCQSCHGTDGKGVAGMLDSPDPPDFTRRVWQEERSDARLLRSILEGKKKGMPAFRKDLTEDQARDLVDYIRALTPPRRAKSTEPHEGHGDGQGQGSSIRNQESEVSTSNSVLAPDSWLMRLLIGSAC